jgi:hypothetical protein
VLGFRDRFCCDGYIEPLKSHILDSRLAGVETHFGAMLFAAPSIGKANVATARDRVHPDRCDEALQMLALASGRWPGRRRGRDSIGAASRAGGTAP